MNPHESIMNPAGIYVSVPFCTQKCTYCNFASGVHPRSDLAAYLKALDKEITARDQWWSQAGLPDSPIGPVGGDLFADTVYFGGGTPSLLAPGDFQALLNSLRDSFRLLPGAEVTLEASPETVTAENAMAWAACGVNRVSLGVQSLVAQELRAVGRMHREETVMHAFTALRQAGIHNISADLIAGLPHQTAASWEKTLRRLLELKPAHVSVYMLEVDEDSRLGGELLHRGTRYGATAVPPEEQIVAMYTRARDTLREAGYQHYEISNFALPGNESRHNEKYWTGAPYFGFGADAHSYDGSRRWANVETAEEYVERLESGRTPVQEWRQLSAEERLEERFFLGLRRREGIRGSQIAAEFGPDALERIRSRTEESFRAGWLERSPDCLRLSEDGVLFSNQVFADLLS